METTALIIFVITYIGIIFTRLPGINIDRPSAAFFGSVAMVVFGVLNFEEAVMAVDYNTIALLLGMMIIISSLQQDGFFSWLARKTITYAGTRTRLMVIVVFVTGIASAFLVNDAVVLLFTPVIIHICRSSRIDPLPYLIAEILASNAGSVMTITGNPQNMLIGVNSGIGYGHYLLYMIPPSLAALALIIPVIRLVYRRHFSSSEPVTYAGPAFDYSWRKMRFSVPIFGGVILLFFFSRMLGLSIPLIALIGGSLVMIFGSVKPSRIIREIDWVLLLFFAALFIVVRGVEKTGLLDPLLHNGFLGADGKSVSLIHGLSLGLSQIVSNVPLTVLMLPMMKSADNEILWLSLASASTLAGNATIIGAMANLIVIESAKSQGVSIRFLEFLKAGLLLTLLSMGLSLLYFWWLI